MFPWMSLVKLAIGIIAIIRGADLFIDAAVWFADRTGIPKAVIGATIVSLATTLPEFAVSSYASYCGHTSMAVGNAVGSAICNIGFIPGVTLLMKEFQVEHSDFVHRGLFMVFAAVALYLLSADGWVSRVDGGILMLVLAAFVYYTLAEAKSSRKKPSIEKVAPNEEDGSIWRTVLRFIGGAMAVVIGSRIVVASGIVLAEYFHVPEAIIGLTLIALGTSLPELVTSLAAVLKGYQELSIGNIIGANFLNMTWVLGGAALINPLSISADNLRVDFPVMGLLMAVVLVSGVIHNRLNKWEGRTILLVYAGYITHIALTTF